MKEGNQFDPYTVTAVAKNTPQNSSIRFDILVSLKIDSWNENWGSHYLGTFVKLAPGADIRLTEAKMKKVYETEAGELIRKREAESKQKNTLVYLLQPFTDIHLSEDYKASNGLSDSSNTMYSYILSGIALFILLIACINFVNLTVARSVKRSKEIGIRKVIGGERRQLITQFLGESFFLCFAAFLFAILIVQLILPSFNQLAGKALYISYLFDTKLVVGYIGLFLITGLLAGFYPALVLSSYNPVQTLYNRFTLSGKSYLQKGLVILQFSLATLLVVSTITIYSQFNYLTNTKLGYDDKNVVIVEKRKLTTNEASLFKEELMKNRDIVKIANRSGGSFIDGASANNRDIGTAILKIDNNYLHVLNIPVLKGRDFSAGFPSDTADAVIVNETFVKEIGWKDDPVGKKVSVSGNDVTVVGVVRDYNFQSLHDKIMPLAIHCGAISQSLDEALIKIKPDEIPQTLSYIEGTFKKILLFDPFEYSFLEQDNAIEYSSELRWKGILSNAAALSVLISCLGLFGLTCLSIVRRTKEIGIRKILGASTSIITLLVLKDFMKLVIIAFIISIPFAWYSADKWLQNFPYRVTVEWWMFMTAGVAAIAVAILTISFQAIRAAISNPVKSLRTE